MPISLPISLSLIEARSRVCYSQTGVEAGRAGQKIMGPSGDNDRFRYRGPSSFSKDAQHPFLRKHH